MLDDPKIYTKDVVQRMIDRTRKHAWGTFLSDEEALLAIINGNGDVDFRDLAEMFDDPPLDLIAAAAKNRQLLVVDKLSYDHLMIIAKNKLLHIIPTERLDAEICEVGVRANTLDLHHVPRKFKTQDMCLRAIKRNPYVIRFIEPDLQTTELCNIAVTGDPQTWHFMRKPPMPLPPNANKERMSNICKLNVNQTFQLLRRAEKALRNDHTLTYPCFPNPSYAEMLIMIEDCNRLWLATKNNV